MQTQTAIAPVVTTFVRRILAPAIVAFGLGLTVGWISIIGYALVSTMIEIVIICLDRRDRREGGLSRRGFCLSKSVGKN